jgi:hypothetical protein
MAWFLVCIDKEHVNEPVKYDSNGTTKEINNHVVLGEYKHATENQAIEDAAKAEGISPLILTAYKLQD